MGVSGGIKEYLEQVFERARAANGKIIGEDGDLIKTELAKTDKQAWVNHLTEQYLKHEILDSPPPEFEVVIEDIVKEISKREIVKIFGES